MKFCYGQMNAVRVLEEAEFWKRQEAEHTQVIQAITPNLETNYVEQLNRFKEAFDSTEAMIIQLSETVINSNYAITAPMQYVIMETIEFTIRQSQSFIDLLSKMLRESSSVKSNPTSGHQPHSKGVRILYWNSKSLSFLINKRAPSARYIQH